MRNVRRLAFLLPLILWSSLAVGQQRSPNEVEIAKLLVKEMGGSCSDVAKLVELSNTTTNENARKFYLAAAEKRRQDAIDRLVASVKRLNKYTKAWWIIGDNDNGTHSDEQTPVDALSSIRSEIEGVRCFLTDEKQTIANALAAQLDELQKSYTQREAVEIKCRKDKACRNKRLAIRNSQELCGLYDERDMFQQIIKEEKGNPSGVVDLVRLHEAGASLQQTDAEIASTKVVYASKVKTPFNRSICKELPIDKETGDSAQSPVEVTLEPSEK